MVVVVVVLTLDGGGDDLCGKSSYIYCFMCPLYMCGRCLAPWRTKFGIGQRAHTHANDKTTGVTFSFLLYSFLSMCGDVLMIHKCLSLIETSLQHLYMTVV